MSAPRPILVAGKTGQLARCLAREARRRGTALVATGRPELDLTQADALARAVEAHAARAIVNAAAYTAVDKAEAEPALAMAVNRDGASALAAAAARMRARPCCSRAASSPDAAPPSGIAPW